MAFRPASRLGRTSPPYWPASDGRRRCATIGRCSPHAFRRRPTRIYRRRYRTAAALSLRGRPTREGLADVNLPLWRTPTGVFRIVARIGAGEPDDEILKARVPTSEIAQLVTAPDDPAASDTVVGRILRLEGLEPGWNEGGDVDTFDRDIYIHGTANAGMIGRPASNGCVQMKPKAVAQLFTEVPRGTLVLITTGWGNLDVIPGLTLPTAPPRETPTLAGNTRDTQNPGTATSFRTSDGDDPTDSPDAFPGA